MEQEEYDSNNPDLYELQNDWSAAYYFNGGGHHHTHSSDYGRCDEIENKNSMGY